MSAPRTVLLVEDSEPIRDAFTILLEDAGYTVLGAGTGEEALRLTSGHRPDLVLLDMGLPDMSGLDVVRRIKAAPAAAPAWAWRLPSNSWNCTAAASGW